MQTFPSVIIGDDFKLSIPGVLFAAVDFPDLWLLEGQNLFQSNDSLDSSGKPNGIDTLRPGTKNSVPTPLPFASCRSRNVPWPNSSLDITQGGFCNALSPKARHGESVYLFATSPDSGSGKFICNNGSWESDGPASQYQSCSKPIVFRTCPKKDVTWTSGYNGLTCSGTLEQGLAVVGTYGVYSSDPINSGVGFFYCGGDINGEMSWTYNDMFSSCIARPPAPAPITDPKLLAQSKNCLTCHGESTPYSPYIGPSFKQISDYYKLNPQSTATTEYRIKFGNTGNFGTLPMPANPQVSGDDLAIIIPWILAK